jgi:hypothetical protein
MSSSYLVPLAPMVINGRQITAPKYALTDLLNVNYASIAYGLEPIALVTVAKPNAALSAELDVYTFPADLTVLLAASDVAKLSAFLAANNIPSDQVFAGMSWAAALVVVARIFLTAQFVAGTTNQSGSLFTNGVTLTSPAAASPVLAAAVAAAVATQPVQPNQTAPPVQSQSAPASQGAGIPDAGAGNSGTNPPPASAPFSFAAIPNTATVGQFLSTASKTWAGPISLGGF